ncbi:C-Jun-amino-terminal kinase-interacting protein 4-like [Carcharodon carcharias]|uniref:C-Jun-amino-terminal kinase-interacting protein 4-like n=1 Tax=Carcharodon carcharias TaxID=13397 RepID=UPI001B7E5D13|nr:C-Jun-amino-terminal kinase-interacting protein 4-like [Carcharodon carcharias]
MSQAAEAKLQVSSGSLWICSGSHSETEVMVLDATRANHVLDHFTIANCRILCIASVPAHPGAQEEREPSWRQAAASRDPASHGHTSAEPTVWLGSQSGRLFLHLTDCCRRRCLHLVQLAECVHSIVYTGGFVVVTLGNGMLEIFHRNPDGTWDLTGHRSLDLGPPRHSVRCVVSVSDGVWCGYRNRVYIINLKHLKIQKWFEVTPHPERQVRHLAGQDEGVWVSVRLESVLRLFHTHSAQLLQEVNIQPFVTNMFGSRPPGLSLLQVTALSVICERLWIGTGTGFIVSAPLSAELAAGSIPKISNGAPAGQEDPLQGVAVPSTIPYCAMSLAQICFHGHRDAVRFFVSVSVSGPASQRVGVAADRASPPPSEEETTVLVVSGGEGYINFRIGEAGETYRGTPAMLKSERSHLVVSRVRT